MVCPPPLRTPTVSSITGWAEAHIEKKHLAIIQPSGSSVNLP